MGTSEKKLIIFMPSIEDGGVEKNLVNISNFLTNKISNISLVTAFANNKYKFSKKIKIQCLKKKIKTKRRTKYLIGIYLLIKELLKDNSQKVVLSFQANIYCIIVCKIFGAKIITRSNASIHGWSKNFRLALYKYFYSKADNLIVNSRALKIEFKKILKLNAKLIYNPLDKSRILKLCRKNKKFNFYRQNSINIINIGRLVEQKDHLTLLRALNLIKKKINFKLIIIGEGNYLNKIKYFIYKNDLKNNVKILKFTRNPFLHLLKSDIFILSSKFEGLPNVLMEAMLLKKLVISSNCPTGPKEILQNGKLGFLFPVENYKKLSRLILNYSKNKKKNTNKIKNAYKSLDRFDYKKNLNLYYNIIKKSFDEKKLHS